MNFTKAIDLMTDTEKRMKEIDAALHDLRNALAAIAELDNGAKADMILKCNGLTEPVHIGNLMDEGLLTKYVRDRLELVARSNFEKLLYFRPEEKSDIQEEEMPPLKIPDELARKKEQREEPSENLPVEAIAHEVEPMPKVIGKNGKAIVNDALIARMYFKDGKSGKQIAAETGLSESAVFNHLAKIRAAKEQAAKECARQS